MEPRHVRLLNQLTTIISAPNTASHILLRSLSLNGYAMHWLRTLFTPTPKLDRADATASAAMFLVETLADVMVRTTYGLTNAGMANMFRASADHLVQNADQAEDESERAGLLLMAKEIYDMAKRLENKK